MNDMIIIKKMYKRYFLIGFFCMVNLVLFLLFGDEIYDYFINAATPGSYSHKQDIKFLAVCFYSIFLIFIPRVIELLKFTLDLIFKKQKTIKVTGTKRPQPPWNIREDYVIFHAKNSSEIPYKFIVFKDIYSLKGKKIDNTYEVTYFVFSKVVTNMKKCKKDS